MISQPSQSPGGAARAPLPPARHGRGRVAARHTTSASSRRGPCSGDRRRRRGDTGAPARGPAGKDLLQMLEGVRVVDLTTDIAGPYCTKVLADAGADVVKVEPPAGDPLRRWGSGALFEFLNTSKRSVQGEADELVAAADILVAGAPVDLGALWAANPALVVVTITPFGCDGPWAERPSTEFTLQAACGSTGQRGAARTATAGRRGPDRRVGDRHVRRARRRGRVQGSPAVRAGRARGRGHARLHGRDDGHLPLGVRLVLGMARPVRHGSGDRGAVGGAQQGRLLQRSPRTAPSSSRISSS